MANQETKSACTYHACAMYPTGKNTAEKLAVTREVKTSKSHVNATIRRVHSQFGNLCQATPLTWPTDRGHIEQT